MGKERHITVRENGQVVYEGPEQRHFQQHMVPQGPSFLGIPIKDWAVIVVPIFTLGVVSVNLQKTMKSCDYLIGFASNSDSYNSARTGIQFKQGMPIGAQAWAAEKNQGDKVHG